MCVDSLEIFRKIDEKAKTESPLEELLNTDLHAVQNQNEKTPSKRPSFAVISRTPYEKPIAARRLFESSTSTQNSPTTSNGSANKMPGRKSFRLSDIYERLHEKKPSISHSAEFDTIHLLLCAIAVKEEFVKEADSMFTKFADVK